MDLKAAQLLPPHANFQRALELAVVMLIDFPEACICCFLMPL